MFGQGLYELRNVNLMEWKMIHYLSRDLTISGPDGQTIASVTKPCQCLYRHLPRRLLSIPISTLSDSPPSYTTYPKDDRDSFISPIRTPHLIPLANRHRRRLVPRLHLRKTLVCRRHQEASSSASNLSAPHRTSK